MQRLEVSCAVRLIYTSLGAKGTFDFQIAVYLTVHYLIEIIHFQILALTRNGQTQTFVKDHLQTNMW